MKSIVSILLILTMLCTLTACGKKEDKTPSAAATDDDEKIAVELLGDPMTIDGIAITKEEYTAVLYQMFYRCYYEAGLYQYVAYDMDPWEQTFPYGDAGVELATEEYIIQCTKDAIIRQMAVQKLMKQYGVEVDPDELAEYKAGYAFVDENEMLCYGFDKESYMKMELAGLEESSLFYTLYGEDGERAVPAEELRDCFEKNFVAYKAITIAQVDSDGNALSKEEQAKNKETLETYLALYHELNDMDAVIDRYYTDEDIEKVELWNEKYRKEPNMHFLNSIEGDENVVKAVLGIAVGDAAIVEYTDWNDESYVALVLRYDVEEAAVLAGEVEKSDDYYNTERKELCVYGLKYDEFDEEIKSLMNTLTVVYDDKTIVSIRPKAFTEVETPRDPPTFEGDFRLIGEDGNEWVMTDFVDTVEATWQADTTTGETYPVLSITFKGTGIEWLEDATKSNYGKVLQHWLGDEMWSAPTVNEVITDGNVILKIDEDYEYTEQVAQALMTAVENAKRGETYH